MGAHQPQNPRVSKNGTETLNKGTGLKRVQVLPDIYGLDEELTYLIPKELEGSELLQPGSIVGISIRSRKQRGWITQVLDRGTEGQDFKPKPIEGFLSYGPPPQVLKLADWAAKRWVGRRAAFYRAASPPKNVKKLPPAPDPYDWPSFGQGMPAVVEALKTGGIIQLAPAFDIWQVIEEALAFKSLLILVPSPSAAEQIANRLKSQGLPVALMPEQWAMARSGNCIVVGTRAAALAPISKPEIVITLDEQDEAYWSLSSPTYNACEIAQKRAQQMKVPCLLTSATPSLRALNSLPHFQLSRDEQFKGWPRLQIVDCLDPERQREGLLTEPLLRELRHKDRKIICVLNRTGRIRLLACRKCEQLLICKRCGSALHQNQPDLLECLRCQMSRKSLCRYCGHERFKNLRMGVSKLRENLQALIREPVEEITAQSKSQFQKSKTKMTRVAVGTTAVLYSGLTADVIAFLDFDQELLAPNFRAYEKSLELLARAGTMLGRRQKNQCILVQTRIPDHIVIQSAASANPQLLSKEDARQRKELGFPPFMAVAEIGRTGAKEYIENLHKLNSSLEIQGPVDGRWLVKAHTVGELSSILGKVERPAGKDIRIAVNPYVF